MRITMENEFEADVFGNLLEKEGIPYAVVPHYSLAYDGIFQAAMGWGHMEVPDEHAETAALLYKAYRESRGK